MLSLTLALSPFLFAQQPVDGTNSGAPAAQPGQPSAAAAMTTRNGLTTTTTLTAIDSKTISSNSSSNWNDNRFRAYWSSSSQGFVDGFVKFDLSTIPNTATITAMTLRAYHEEGFGNPRDNPEVRCYRVGDDSWARGATDSHPGVAESLTGIYTGFPTANLVPVDFILDPNAADWSTDLADDRLSLLLRNEAGSVGRYSYVYFYGSDASPAPPELIIEYSDGPQLILSNLVGGQTAIIEVVGAAPNATCLVGWSKSGGPTSLITPWGTFQVDLGLPINQLAPLTADANGYANAAQSVPVAATGLTIYAHALTVDAGGNGELTNSLVEIVL